MSDIEEQEEITERLKEGTKVKLKNSDLPFINFDSSKPNLDTALNIEPEDATRAYNILEEEWNKEVVRARNRSQSSMNILNVFGECYMRLARDKRPAKEFIIICVQLGRTIGTQAARNVQFFELQKKAQQGDSVTGKVEGRRIGNLPPN
tara:strand:+ start:491 stop:937 length:447 start_codon:yes stop_codon:yes gene_type:complete